MTRRTTGNAEIDMILHGGIPEGSVVVVHGPPGAGKSLLGHQISSANATADRPAIHLTTLSEPQAKIVRNLRGFDFFDEATIGSDLRLMNVSESMARAGDAALRLLSDEVVRGVYEAHASVVVVDSSRVLHDFGSPSEVRRAVFEMTGRVGHTDAILLLVGEYPADAVSDWPEFAVADVIIELTNDDLADRERRTLRVVKQRGSSFIPGRHHFTIGPSGIEADARLTSLPLHASDARDGRAGLGGSQRDEMTGGGIPRGEAALVMGPAGSGKTTLAYEFLAAGLAEGERGLIVTLEESVAEVFDKSDTFGLGFRAASDAGLLRVVPASSSQTDLDRLGHIVRDAVDDHRPERVVLDSLSTLEPAIHGFASSPAYQVALISSLVAGGATAVIPYEVRSLLGQATAPEGASTLTNNVLQIRYLERGSELGRVFSVLKMRRSDHDKGLLRFEIGESGLEEIGVAGNVSRLSGWSVVSNLDE